MKAESLKHLQKMYELCPEDMGYFKELIEAIIRIESADEKKGKFKIWDCVGKDKIRPSMCCVLHDSGFKVASDAHILVALKEEYPDEMEGKLLKKDGTIETEHTRYPNWRSVIPDPQRSGMVKVELDLERVRGFEKDYKARIKARGYSDSGYVCITGNCWFKIDYLMKMVRFMEYVGTSHIWVNPDGNRASLAVSGDSKCILMPVYSAPETSEFLYKL